MKNFYSPEKSTGPIHCIMCHPSDEGALVVGSEKIALIDCGMAFCAPKKIEKIKAIIGERKPDYLIVGHSHYDHIGSIPHMKKEWPNASVISSEYAAKVFLRPGALKTIRELSIEAATTYGAANEDYVADYEDSAFKTDIVVSEKDRIDLGGVTLEVIETPGHTRDGISFYIPELEMIKADETLGVLTGENSMYPVYLVSYLLAKQAVDKCEAYHPKRIYSPHWGEVSEEQCAIYFELARKTMDECRDLIVSAYNEGKSEQEIISLFSKAYRNPNLIDKQPEKAFELNTAVTVRTTIKECAEL